MSPVPVCLEASAGPTQACTLRGSGRIQDAAAKNSRENVVDRQPTKDCDLKGHRAVGPDLVQMQAKQCNLEQKAEQAAKDVAVAKETALDSMLEFLDQWEAHARGLGFLSKSTSEGLRVTIHSTKDLLKYLTEKVGFRYFMTSRLSQDCLERSFGIVRQSSGANDHATPAQFIIIIKCISFYSLAKSPKGGNVSPGLLESLLSENSCSKTAQEEETA
ncbi:hypothetical protein HPB49_007116 [Dermacentor silvarum]|uniref:Uncharacterized protein n=1 Tax=Dermacentor silvarum TaxID=543639 RepID=A0ACB8DWT9_DERSI|nr:hypothetical protein HPB49_007116 [Dermacentor silvarum]